MALTRPVIFRPAAEQEMLEAERWFEGHQAALGRRFRSSVDQTIERMREFPLSSPIPLRNLLRTQPRHGRSGRCSPWTSRPCRVEIEALRPNTACTRRHDDSGRAAGDASR